MYNNKEQAFGMKSRRLEIYLCILIGSTTFCMVTNFVKTIMKVICYKRKYK